MLTITRPNYRVKPHICVAAVPGGLPKVLTVTITNCDNTTHSTHLNIIGGVKNAAPTITTTSIPWLFALPTVNRRSPVLRGLIAEC